jgi:hypothetical protein
MVSMTARDFGVCALVLCLEIDCDDDGDMGTER